MTSSLLQSLNQIFEAGIAISALSLFLRALTFNLRDRVSRSFAIVLACLVVVFSGEAISGAVEIGNVQDFWLKTQWVGIVFLPAALVHFSDALLETTGQPSRGRRSKLVVIGYIISFLFLLTLFFGSLLGPVTFEGPVPHLTRTSLSTFFIAIYLIAVIFSVWSIWRAYKRTKLRVSRRRMWYLMAGVLFISFGTYPYLQIGSGFAFANPEIFISLATLGNMAVFFFLLMMAYAVAFFGVPWPDRLIKSRLFKWFLRGPATVFIVLFMITFARESGNYFESNYAVSIPIITAITVLFMEHLITLIFPTLERLFFNSGDQGNIQLLQTISDRLITTGDLKQFLEAVIASACDQLQVSTAFIAAFDQGGIEQVVQVGDKQLLEKIGLDQTLLERVSESQNGNQSVFAWGDFWLFPLFSPQKGSLLGLLGVLQSGKLPLEENQRIAMNLLGERAALALDDRNMQQQIFNALQELEPKVDMIQRLRAATRYDQREMFTDLDLLSEDKSVNQLVKEALSHYWGGPKLSESPLLSLQVVQEALKENDGNAVNALRSTLKEAISRVRPVGDRRFTAEWILFNILEMKFMEGRKVREIALRLAMSEADLYRKQRIAIEEVSKVVLDMERIARSDGNGGES
ncbi:MAG: hypothetical protein HON98_00190 [Chloroflexi bacterium]|jgi:hypothetical protein|nr:hypothetical protein [Chloroflexota bacterium]MBT4003929.1 hypothetical protein [Chloroflexota bacterium]MBT4305765.1 hypothetical protein [Chloroflexota bacterium]MBT4533589.1 hypothetical protein [Chloroflexota bacterium]MBT4754090.1 hypothetical protein [Chloroflexota bacterium]